MTNSIDPLTELVGINIYNRRRQLGLTQEQLAEIIGIGQQSLSRMEKGRIAPKFSRLQIFADALKCSVADLFRMPNENTNDKAAAIADIIRILPQDGQEGVVKIMAEMVRVMRVGS